MSKDRIADVVLFLVIAAVVFFVLWLCTGLGCTAADQGIIDAGATTQLPVVHAVAAPIQDVNQQAAGQVAINADAQLTLTTYMPWAMVVLLTLWNFAREAGIAFAKWQDAKTERARIQAFGGDRRRP